MAEKIILENFENFEGLDADSTYLTRKPTAFGVITNTRFGEGGSLRKRPGYQRVGQEAYFEKIHSYKYQDTKSGETKEELLGINRYLWRLKEGSITVTGGTTLTATVTALAGSIRLAILDAGTPYTFSGNPYITLSNDIGNLIETIDAHASLVCVINASLRFAKTSAASTLGVLTVNSGHTYVVGDWLYAFNNITGDIEPAKVTAITATTITLNTNLPATSGLFVGPSAAKADGIPLGSHTGSGSTLSIPFYYWDIVPFTTLHYNVWPYYTSVVVPGRSLWSPFDNNNFSDTNPIRPCFLNAHNCCYIYYGTDETEFEPFKGFPFKYDGQTVYREGVPPAFAGTVNLVGSGSLTGVFKYKLLVAQYDNRGNIIEGQLSSSRTVTLAADSAAITLYNPIYKFENTTSPTIMATVDGDQSNVITMAVSANTIKTGDWVCFTSSSSVLVARKITSATSTTISFIGFVSVNDAAPIYLAGTLGLNTKGATVNPGASGVNAVTVYGGVTRNTVDVGDTIFFYDSSRTQYITRMVTARTDTTITFDGDPVSVLANTNISVNLRLSIFRTKAGGNIYYRITDIPVSVESDRTTIADNAADSLLVERLIEPEIGFEPTMPPKARIATIHQGARVASAIYPGANSETGENEGNTVAIYDVINIESVPIGSGVNFIDVPSNVRGSISGLASDGDNSLAVFKPNAYYAINGDILGGGASINSVTEGDFGISSHNSIKKINGAIFGVGTLGVLVVSNGQIIKQVMTPVNSLIRNNRNIKLGAAEAENDYYNMGYMVYVPHNTASATAADAL